MRRFIGLSVFLRWGVCLLSFLLPGQVRGQVDPGTLLHIPHGHWTEENGLPGNSVRTLAQTPEGYVWLGMEQGLVRFDGRHFVSVPVETACPGSGCRVLERRRVGAAGRRWADTLGHCLMHLEGQGLKTFRGEGVPALDAEVTCLLTASDQSLWVGTRQGLRRLTSEGMKRVDLPGGQGRAHITALAEDHSGAVWVATSGGVLLRLVMRDWGIEGERVVAGVPGEVSSLLWVSGDELWVGTTGQGLFRMNAVEGRLQGVESLRQTWVTCLFLDSRGHAWVGTYGDGLWVRPRGAQAIRPFAPKAEPLACHTITELMEDREQSLWVATIGDGVTILRESVVQTYHAGNGLAGNMIFGVYEDRKGRIWSGALGSGVTCMDGERMHVLNAQRGFPSHMVVSFCETHDGALWMGAMGLGLIRCAELDSWKVFGKERGMVDCSVRVVCADRSGRVWVGTQQGNVYRLEGERFHHVADVGARVTQMMADHEDGMLICTLGRGVLQMEETGRIRALGGLPGKVYLSACRDSDGGLWLGAFGLGLVHRDPEGRVAVFTGREGLPDPHIYAILEDGQMNLWCSSNTGIFRISRPSLREKLSRGGGFLAINRYGKESGMRCLECNGGSQPSGICDSRGCVWFPTVRGLVCVQPMRSLANRTPPAILVERMDVNGKVWTPEQGGGVIREKIQDLDIRFSAISFVFPERMRSRYRLEGWELNWHDATGAPVARYRNLAAGTYRFVVQACNADGVWNTLGAALPFSVAPTSWRPSASWLILPAILLAGWLVAWFWRMRCAAWDRVEVGVRVEPRGDEEEALRQLAFLDHLVRREHLYRNPNLSIGDLARKAILGARTISRLLNEHRGQHFFEYINAFRVEEAYRILLDSQMRDEKSILQIAYDVGFNSKSAFNRSFKKVYGVTPSQVRACGPVKRGEGQAVAATD